VKDVSHTTTICVASVSVYVFYVVQSVPSLANDSTLLKRVESLARLGTD